jgi:hypothetical protein
MMVNCAALKQYGRSGGGEYHNSHGFLLLHRCAGSGVGSHMVGPTDKHAKTHPQYTRPPFQSAADCLGPSLGSQFCRVFTKLPADLPLGVNSAVSCGAAASLFDASIGLNGGGSRP